MHPNVSDVCYLKNPVTLVRSKNAGIQISGRLFFETLVFNLPLQSATYSDGRFDVRGTQGQVTLGAGTFQAFITEPSHHASEY
jgi:hypothetical protein